MDDDDTVEVPYSHADEHDAAARAMRSVRLGTTDDPDVVGLLRDWEMRKRMLIGGIQLIGKTARTEVPMQHVKRSRGNAKALMRVADTLEQIRWKPEQINAMRMAADAELREADDILRGAARKAPERDDAARWFLSAWKDCQKECGADGFPKLWGRTKGERTDAFTSPAVEEFWEVLRESGLLWDEDGSMLTVEAVRGLLRRAKAQWPRDERSILRASAIRRKLPKNQVG